MNQYYETNARHPQASEDALAGPVIHRIEAWTPPTPRWQDSAARARLGQARAHTRAATQPGVLQRVRRRVDLIGWLLAQPNDRIGFNTDPHDPRVILYKRMIGTTHRYNDIQASLLRFNGLRV